MQTVLENILTKKYLLASLVASTVIILTANAVGKDTAILVGNLIYIPITGVLLVLAFLTLARFGIIGYHGVAWVSFVGYAICAFIAEMLWAIMELYFKIDPFPSAADIFYLIEYPFLLMFFIAYLQPIKNAITKKMFAIAILISATILAACKILVSTPTQDELFEVFLGSIYPIFDSIVLVPAIIGVSLFFKGKINLMWSLFFFGTISLFIADSAFLFGQGENSYYTGNPMEILFHWNYILLSFGLYSNLVLFTKPKKHQTFDDLT
jgi:hypothetical protein